MEEPNVVQIGKIQFEEFLTSRDINKMKKDEIVAKLAALRLNAKGNKEEVSKRLKLYWKRRRVVDNAVTPRDRFYDFLCVIDFECTCEGRSNPNYPHEIIEFPAVLLRTTTGEVVDEFHSFCKPSVNAELSTFCKGLTGITQEQVDNAPPFVEVWNDFVAFLQKHELGSKYRFAYVTDGPADFGNFLQLQFQHLSTPLPHDVRYWINLRRSYCRIYKKQKTNLQSMLNELGLEFMGRQHSGLDDARNIARVAVSMIEGGCQLWINERLLRRDRLEAAGKLVDPVVGNSKTEDDAAEDEWVTLTPNPPPKREPKKELGPVASQAEILPYKVIIVSKEEFSHDEYERCFTCDESDGE